MSPVTVGSSVMTTSAFGSVSMLSASVTPHSAFICPTSPATVAGSVRSVGSTTTSNRVILSRQVRSMWFSRRGCMSGV